MELNKEMELPPPAPTPPPPAPTEPPAPDPINEDALGASISPDAYFNYITEDDIKPSADSVLNEDTGKLETNTPQDPERPKMTSEEARTKTERFIQMRDMLQSRGLAYLAKNPEDFEKFLLDKWEKDWLIDLYTGTIEKIGFIPVWLEIVMAEAVIMGPKIKKAFDMGKLEEKNREQAAYIAQLQNELNQAHSPAPRQTSFKSNATPPPAPGTTRPDAKKYWTIDENGFFDYDESGNYVKQPHRISKPDLTTEAYKILVKYNGEAKVKRVFKIDSE